MKTVELVLIVQGSQTKCLQEARQAIKLYILAGAVVTGKYVFFLSGSCSPTLTDHAL